MDGGMAIAMLRIQTVTSIILAVEAARWGLLGRRIEMCLQKDQTSPIASTPPMFVATCTNAVLSSLKTALISAEKRNCSPVKGDSWKGEHRRRNGWIREEMVHGAKCGSKPPVSREKEAHSCQCCNLNAQYLGCCFLTGSALKTCHDIFTSAQSRTHFCVLVRSIEDFWAWLQSTAPEGGWKPNQRQPRRSTSARRRTLLL